jgi:hypothetical protein
VVPSIGTTVPSKLQMLNSNAPRKMINIAALFHWTADTIVKQVAAMSSNAQ